MKNKKTNLTHISDRLICFLYRKLLWPWENGLNKRQFPNFDVIDKVLPKELIVEPMRSVEQMLRLQNDWKQRKDQYLVLEKIGSKKAQALIYYLRNAFAHGDISMCTRNKIRMIQINHIYEKKLRLFGQLTEYNLQQLILAITTHVK